MADVIPFRSGPQRPVECERALNLMQEAMGVLDDLAERGLIEVGGAPDTTRAYLEDAIGMLTPPTAEEMREYEIEDQRLTAKGEA